VGELPQGSQRRRPQLPQRDAASGALYTSSRAPAETATSAAKDRKKEAGMAWLTASEEWEWAVELLLGERPRLPAQPDRDVEEAAGRVAGPEVPQSRHDHLNHR
jgi:hypothetical protein